MEETRKAGAMGPGAIPKPDEAAKEFFRSLVPDDPRVQVRPMFGNLSAFVNGQMFFGLYGNDIFVRLPESDRDSVIREGGANLEPMPGRPMREYVTLPAARRADRGRAQPLVSRALDYAASLPPREPRRKARPDPR